MQHHHDNFFLPTTTYHPDDGILPSVSDLGNDFQFPLNYDVPSDNITATSQNNRECNEVWHHHQEFINSTAHPMHWGVADGQSPFFPPNPHWQPPIPHVTPPYPVMTYAAHVPPSGLQGGPPPPLPPNIAPAPVHDAASQIGSAEERRLAYLADRHMHHLRALQQPSHRIYFVETRLVDDQRRCTYCAAVQRKVTASEVSRHFMSHVLEDVYDGPGRTRRSILYDLNKISIAFDFMERRADLFCPRCTEVNGFMYPPSMEHHMHTVHKERDYRLPGMARSFGREARDLLTQLGFQVDQLPGR